MDGNRVIVRAYKGEPLLRYVSKIEGDLVYITNDLKEEAIGFPKEDIFKYDHAGQNYLKDRKCDWSKLTPLVNAT